MSGGDPYKRMAEQIAEARSAAAAVATAGGGGGGKKRTGPKSKVSFAATVATTMPPPPPPPVADVVPKPPWKPKMPMQPTVPPVHPEPSGPSTEAGTMRGHTGGQGSDGHGYSGGAPDGTPTIVRAANEQRYVASNGMFFQPNTLLSEADARPQPPFDRVGAYSQAPVDGDAFDAAYARADLDCVKRFVDCVAGLTHTRSAAYYDDANQFLAWKNQIDLLERDAKRRRRRVDADAAAADDDDDERQSLFSTPRFENENDDDDDDTYRSGSSSSSTSRRRRLTESVELEKAMQHQKPWEFMCAICGTLARGAMTQAWRRWVVPTVGASITQNDVLKHPEVWEAWANMTVAVLDQTVKRGSRIYSIKTQQSIRSINDNRLVEAVATLRRVYGSSRLY